MKLARVYSLNYTYLSVGEFCCQRLSIQVDCRGGYVLETCKITLSQKM